VTIAALAPFRTEPAPRPVDDDFSGLYRHYRPQLLRYVTHHFGPRDADEITQESLTRALRAMDRDRSEAETWAWLVRVARNVAHDLARSRRICETTDDDMLLANDVADDAILPEPAALLDEKRRLVRRALKTLPPSQRRILVLYEVDELNCPAIARLVGSTEDAVRKALQRARRRFAAEVRALGGGGAAGSVVWLLRGLRRRPVKTVPAASASTAICALVGSAVLTVTGGSIAPTLLSPDLVRPASASAAERELGPAGTAAPAGAATTRTAAASGETATTPPTMATDGTLVFVPRTPFSPGAKETRVRLTVHVPYREPVRVNSRVWRGDAPGVVCSLPAVSCE
jgi:RNA polymerase sigma-70 factor (ECF subfamily)